MKRLILTLMIVVASLLTWADNNVTINYNGTTATVTVDDNVAQYLTVTQSGAHVSIVQSANVASEITYTLTGTSTNGEFYMSGSYKATIQLNGLTLTNTTPVYSGAAIHIQNSKRINIKVVDGTTNTLTDAANGSQKGCLYVKGHAEFKQRGTLTVVGNTNHGIKAGEYISIKNATINVTSAVGDGISCNQYFLMESGSVNISGTGDDGIQCDLDGTTSTGMTTDHEDEDSGNVYISGGTIIINCAAIAAKGIKSAGDMYISGEPTVKVTTTGKGEWDTTDLETNSACGLSADGDFNVSGGTINLTATGSGGKGMKCDGFMTISGGHIIVSTSGGLYYNNGTTENTNYTGNTDNVNSNYYSSAKGIKAGTKTTSGNSTTYSGGLVITGGTISVTTSGNNAEGIESKNNIIITGGEIIVDAHDDGINAAQDMTISDGYIYSRSSNNDGMDTNGDFFIQGGLVYAMGATSPEVAIDANTEGNKKFYFSGGTLIAIGGLERGSELTQTCYQSSSWSTNTWYAMTFGSTVIAFKTPASAGSLLVLSASSTPTLKSGVTINGGTSLFEGRCYIDPTTTGGSNVSLSQYNNGGGGGGNPPGPGGNIYTITATVNPTTGGSVSGAGTYRRGATCTLTATANSGYAFVNWTKNGTVVSTNATYSFQVTGNASFVANFVQNSSTFVVTATSSDPSCGTVSGGGEFSYGQSCTVTATPADGYTFTGWTENGVMVSGANPYTFSVTSDHSLVATFVHAIEIGTNTTTNNYLPGYNYYRFTLSQQIYTANEIGTAGIINSIAFYNGGAEKTRTYEFYLKATTKSSFSNQTDWITVSASDKVFSGQVTMTANAWTFITFTTPFEYDGTSNLVLVTDDNSNAYTNAPHMACSVFNTSVNQAMYVYSDNTNYSPLSPPSSYGSGYYSEYHGVLSVKNHILLGITPVDSEFHFVAEGNWSNAANWQGGTLPEAGDDVIIEAPCSLDMDAEVTNLTISDGQSLTLQSGKTLTVTGTLTNTVNAGLVIADGAQLVASGSVNGTMQKNIGGYSDTGGWRLITSPVNGIRPSLVANMLSNSYDLYYYDQSQPLEWINYKSGVFNLASGKGYLCANSDSVTLSFAGLLNSHNGAVTLDYVTEAETPGWNLVGNPYPCNAYLAEQRPFYVMNSVGNEIIAAESQVISPLQGIFVVTSNPNGETIYFTKAFTGSKSQVVINLFGGNSTSSIIDRAIINFDGGSTLEKFMLNEGGTKVYFTENGQDYAVVSHHDENSTPISFKASQDGVYTLSVDIHNLDMDYLHLIDNETGANINLLVNPNYTFEAKTTDSANRFKVVYATMEN